MAKVSVVIPTYNRADMVGDAIQSVLDQTFTDWGLVVVDDGSEDSTRDVVSGFDDPRIRYIYQENRKLPGARNTGIRASSGDYVAFLDSDDLFLPEKLETQVAALDRNSDVGCIASGWMEVDSNGAPLRTLRPWRLKSGLAPSDWLYGCPVTVPAVLVRRHWLVRVGLFDEEQHYVEDWDLWLRLVYAGCQMAWEPTIVFLRTMHQGNMVHNAAQMTEGLFRLFDKFFGQPGLEEDLLQQRGRVYANAHLNAAVRFLAAGSAETSAEHLRNAIALDPSLLDGDPPRALQSIASTALTHQVDDVERYIADVCTGLPMVSPKLARSRRQLRAAIRATAAFEDWIHERRWSARRHAAWALIMDPTWLRNRGLVGILLKP